MTGLDSIAVVVEGGDMPTGNLLPLLHEIRHALNALQSSGQPTTIDLRAMPFAPGEEEQLEALLGVGEVDATLNALGPSRILETGIQGVWLVTHLNTNGETMGKYVEVTLIPQLLAADPGDLATGLERLRERIAQLGN